MARDEMHEVLRVATLTDNGIDEATIALQLGIDSADVLRLRRLAREFVEVRYIVPPDEDRELELINKFSLSDAVVVDTADEADDLRVVGTAAARYFTLNVPADAGVGVTCGETLLEMIQALPRRRHMRLHITQLSLEGDPRTVHQAPATLVGMLRAKCASDSTVFGLQLFPPGIIPAYDRVRREIIASDAIGELHRRAAACNFLFIGVGAVSLRATKQSGFVTLSRSLLGERVFDDFVKREGIVGEINNCLFDRQGNDRTDELPQLAERFINILRVDEIRAMAGARGAHRVVAVAAGLDKVPAIASAAFSGLFNVLVTSRSTADRLLEV